MSKDYKYSLSVSTPNGVITRPEEYTQVVIWPETIVIMHQTVLCKDEAIKEFEEWFLSEYNFRVKYLEEILTNPDHPGCHVTGGRSDVFFAIHTDDIERFAGWRLQHSMRWVEDVFYNNQSYLYPNYVKEYKTWDAGNVKDLSQNDLDILMGKKPRLLH